MGNNKSTKSTAYPDILNPDNMALFLSLIDEVSLEIDDDYKDDTLTKQKNNDPHDFVTNIKSINDLYTFKSTIGQGVSGSVFLAQSIAIETEKQYALKTMSRSDKLNQFSFLREIKVLRAINHPNIVQFSAAYTSDEHYYIATEYCSGGTLLERIMKMKRFSERDCADHMRNILCGIQYLHSQNIVHRDIKLSNIVFDHADINNSKLILIDFGEGELITDVSESYGIDPVGSLHYFPPESVRIRRKGDLFASDMWSIGVIAYILIEGRFPFSGRHIKAIMQSIDKYDLRWSAHISESCKDFIESLLNKDMNKRLNAKGALEHPWIVSKASEDDLGDEYFSKLKELNYENKLQKVMVNAVLQGMDETDKMVILTHDGYEDDNQLINQIIWGQTPTPTQTESNIKGFPSYKYTPEISDKSLNDMEIDGIFHEIDAETKATLPPLTPTMDDTISVERFTEILQSSAKKYDIEKIVANVNDDGSQEITFRKIACYHMRMDSMDNF